MQQGKEPLRSFSDLLQFMNQGKGKGGGSDEVVVAADIVVESGVARDLPSTSDFQQPESSESVPSLETGSGDSGDEPRFPTDTNTTA